MKNARMILGITALLCCVVPSFALDAFMAFDADSQKMYAVVRGNSGEEVWAEVTYSQTNEGGFIGDLQMEWPWPNQCVAAAPLSPVDEMRDMDVPDGEENVIVATIHVYGSPDRTVPMDVITLTDTLLAHNNPFTGEAGYSYRAGSCVPIMPDTIRIGTAFCAWVCHGTYSIPIFCEDPGYDPGLLEVTVSNGCAPTGEFATHCNDPYCPRLSWNVFGWYKRVFPNCRLFLVMTYCIAEPGCVCIWRSDFWLPVEILGFSHVAGDGRVTLNWSTASETGQNTFVVTRSDHRDGGYITVHSQEGVEGTSHHNYSWTDYGVQNGHTYYYKLHVIDANGQHVYNVDGQPVIVEATPRAGAATPAEYALSQNFPNPFNAQTAFTFSIAEAGRTTLKVFDLLGREVATLLDKDLDANSYTVNWSAEGLPTGVYMYTLTSGEFSQTKKMLYLK